MPVHPRPQAAPAYLVSPGSVDQRGCLAHAGSVALFAHALGAVVPTLNGSYPAAAGVDAVDEEILALLDASLAEGPVAGPERAFHLALEVGQHLGILRIGDASDDAVAEVVGGLAAVVATRAEGEFELSSHVVAG